MAKIIKSKQNTKKSQKGKSFWSRILPKSTGARLFTFGIVFGLLAGGIYAYRSYADFFPEYIYEYPGDDQTAFTANSTLKGPYPYKDERLPAKSERGFFEEYYLTIDNGQIVNLKDSEALSKFKRAVNKFNGVRNFVVCFRVKLTGFSSYIVVNNGARSKGKYVYQSDNDEYGKQWVCSDHENPANRTRGAAIRVNGSTIHVYNMFVSHTYPVR